MMRRPIDCEALARNVLVTVREDMVASLVDKLDETVIGAGASNIEAVLAGSAVLAGAYFDILAKCVRENLRVGLDPFEAGMLCRRGLETVMCLVAVTLGRVSELVLSALTESNGNPDRFEMLIAELADKLPVRSRSDGGDPRYGV